LIGASISTGRQSTPEAPERPNIQKNNRVTIRARRRIAANNRDGNRDLMGEDAAVASARHDFKLLSALCADIKEFSGVIG
jgi:hypothetical protein